MTETLAFAGTRAPLPTAEEITLDWATSPRWRGIERTYSAEDVVRLRGTVQEEHAGAPRRQRLWQLLQIEDYVAAPGALTGNQAVQMIKAGLQAIYLSGGKWQPTQTLPVTHIPTKVFTRRIRFPRLCDASTMRCCALMRSPGRREMASGTGSSPSSLMRRPALADRSTPSNS